MRERRLHQREKCLRSVDYVVDGRLFQSAIQDISPEGMFISTKEDLPLGTLITACFEVAGENIKNKAVVVRKDSQGIGVAFLHEHVGDELAFKALMGGL